jgi:capsular exopolysaccharide synthesis family protein
MEASHVMQTLARQRWAILLTALLAAVLAGGTAARMGRQYAASATLKVRARELLAPVDQILARPDERVEAPTPEALQAQTAAMVKTTEAMMKSPAVLSPVINRLQLGLTPAQLASQISVREVSPVLVQVTVTDASDPRAREIVNAVTEGFARFAADLRAGEAEKDRQAIQAQLDAARHDLDAAASGKNAALRAAQAEANYRDLLARQAQLQDTATLLRQGAMVTVVDPAGAGSPPIEVSAGRTTKFAAAAFLLGGLLAAVLLVLLEALDRRVRTLPEAEALFGQPVLALVPRAPSDWNARAVATAAGERPTSPLAEAIHFLALRVLRRAPEEGCLVLAGLSARSGQGATVTLTNLAIALAQTGRRIVLVDADLRHPQIHSFFDLPNGRGLSALTAGTVRPEELLAATPIRNLAMITAGDGAANPWEVLRSAGMLRLLETLRGQAQIVLLNTPPADASADAVTVATCADAALAVFRASAVPAAPEAALREALEQSGITLMGVVLNDVRPAEISALRAQISTAAPAAAADLSRPAFASRMGG